ncbi:MAG: exonuclease sbcCD subunit D, partial [Sphingobacteriales bacterium]
SHIRYSGSPVPLSFSENEDKKQVVVIEFRESEIFSLEEHEVPCCRKLIRIKGDLDTVKSKITLLPDHGLKFPAWVEVQIETEAFIHDLDEQLNKLIENKRHIERFFPRQIRTRVTLSLDQYADDAMELNDLDPKKVFLKKCESELGDADYQDLIKTFDEAIEQMRDK